MRQFWMTIALTTALCYGTVFASEAPNKDGTGHNDCWTDLQQTDWYRNMEQVGNGVRIKDDIKVTKLGENPADPKGFSKQEAIAAKNGDAAAQAKVHRLATIYYYGFLVEARRTGGVNMQAVYAFLCVLLLHPEDLEEVYIEKGDVFGGMIFVGKSSGTIMSGRGVLFARKQEAEALKVTVVVDGLPFHFYILKECANACWKYGTLTPSETPGDQPKTPPAQPPTTRQPQTKGSRGLHIEVLTQQNWFNLPEVHGDKITTGSIRHYRSLYGARLTKNWSFLDESPNTVILGAQFTIAKELFNMPAELTGVTNPSDALFLQGLVRGQFNDLSGNVSYSAASGPERDGKSFQAGLHFNPYRWELEAAWQDTTTEEPGVTSDYTAVVGRLGVKPFELFNGLAYLRELWDFNPAIGVAWSSEELIQEHVGFSTRAEIDTEPVRGYFRLFKDLYRADEIDPESGKTIIKWAVYGFTDLQYGNKRIQLFRTEGGVESLIGDIVAPQLDWVVEFGVRINLSEVFRWKRIKERTSQ